MKDYTQKIKNQEIKKKGIYIKTKSFSFFLCSYSLEGDLGKQKKRKNFCELLCFKKSKDNKKSRFFKTKTFPIPKLHPLLI